MSVLPTTTNETADLLATLAAHREFLRGTVRGLSDEQAAAAPTVSALCLGALIKHAAYTEAGWARFIVKGAEGLGPQDATGYENHEASLRMEPGDTLAALLDAYAEVAQATDDLIAGLDELDASHPLPAAPWFEPGASWSARRAVLHIIAETSQHAGHADIIRETIDGAKSMG